MTLIKGDIFIALFNNKGARRKETIALYFYFAFKIVPLHLKRKIAAGLRLSAVFDAKYNVRTLRVSNSLGWLADTEF